MSVKVPAVGPYTMARTMLARCDPGAESPQHAHPSLGQVCVLEGECVCAGKHDGLGSHMLFTVGEEHGPTTMGDQGWVP